jgi:hypothetical protein
MFYNCTAYPTPEKSRSIPFGLCSQTLTIKDLVGERHRLPFRGFCYNCRKNPEYYQVEGKKEKVGFTTESSSIRTCPKCHHAMFWTRKWRKL